ncbi:MAG: ABC transporter permease subunit, partial [Promethearchaeota archaeon]
MVEELEFRKVKAKGWRGGFKNLIIAEFARWKTNMWWINGIVWIIVINGMLGAAVGVIRFRLEAALGLYSGFGGLFTSVAAVIFAQDVIVGEKKSGTAAWVLSKPVSRTAFILSKL